MVKAWRILDNSRIDADRGVRQAIILDGNQRAECLNTVKDAGCSAGGDGDLTPRRDLDPVTFLVVDLMQTAGGRLGKHEADRPGRDILYADSQTSAQERLEHGYEIVG